MINKIKPILIFNHTFEISVFEPEFTPMENLSFLDLEKLSKGNHKLLIGHIEGGCCHKAVNAVIKKGTVQCLQIEKCKDSKPIKQSTEMDAVFQIAKDKLTEKRGPFQPIHIRDLVAAFQARQYDTIIGTGAGCIYICIWHYCLFCCTSVQPFGFPSCWVETRKPDVWM